MKKILYCFLIAAFSAAGCSDGSDGPKGPALQAPSQVVVERVNDVSVRVSWKDNSESEIGFSVWIKQSDDDTAERVGFTVRNVESYIVSSGLEFGKTYYFGVRTDGKNISENSEIVYSSPFYFEDLSLPGVKLIGNPVETESCVAFSYSLRNLPAGATCGICWSADGTPTVDDAHQNGPAVSSSGQAVMQVISNVLLDYGKKYKFRAYLKSGQDIYYGAETEAGLAAEPQAITLNWTKLDTSSLPDAISAYKTTDQLSGHNFNAWYAIADLSAGSVEVRVNVPDALATIDAQSASFGSDCYVMINGGYFYETNHVGLGVVNSVAVGYIPDVRGSLRTGDPEYNEMYHVTRGIFGVDGSGSPAVYWAGTDGSNFYYDRPLPSVRGEVKYDKVSAANPAANVDWQPKYAISAGPVLLKDGKCPFDFTETDKGTEYYLNNYEIIPYDIFGPSVSPDRTAVGRTADGKVILFVCDGRITASGGATLKELAMIMKGLGCVEAINLDGGGSTGMMVGTEHVNYYGDGNRAVKSSLGFFKK